MKIYTGPDFATVYKESLIDLMNSGSLNDPRGTKTKEFLNTALVMENPQACLYENEVRSSQRKYIAGELLWYYSGRNDIDFISRFSKVWQNLQNEDGTANSAYGYLIFKNETVAGFTQFEWVVNCLLADLNTRQAVMHLNLPTHQYIGNKDFVCTMYINFHVREEKLHMTVHMRSNDVVTGTPTDVAFFSTLQMQVLFMLNQVHPNITLGSYTHIADSYHVYDRHYDLVERMIEKPFNPVVIPSIKTSLVSDYKGTPSDDILSLVKYIESGSNDMILCQQDDLLKWITEHAILKNKSSENSTVIAA